MYRKALQEIANLKKDPILQEDYFTNQPYKSFIVANKFRQILLITDPFCFEWIENTLEYHSTLLKRRKQPTVISTSDGVYVFGGLANKTTSDFLPNGGKKWQDGPPIPEPGHWNGDGVEFENTESEKELILIGSYDENNETSKIVLKYNFETKEWTELGKLLSQRKGRISVTYSMKTIYVTDKEPETDENSGGNEETVEVISLSNGFSSKIISKVDFLKTNNKGMI